VKLLEPKRILKTDVMNETSEGMPKPGGITGNLQTDAAIVSVEIDPSQIEKARAFLGDKVEIKLGDIRHLPCGDGEFDLVLDCSTLDHVPQEQMPMVLDEYKRVLKPGGHASVISWASHGPGRYVTNNDGSWSPYYCCYFEYPVLVRAIEDRFEVVEQQRFYEDDNGFLTYFLVKKEDS